MSDILVAAIVTGACTIVAALVVLLGRWWTERRPLMSVSRARRQALDGHWDGSAEIDVTGEGKYDKYEASFEVKPGRKVIRVQGHYWNATLRTHLRLQGGFYNDSFVKLDYANPEPGVFHFGSIILQLSADATELTGRFLGYGRRAQSLVGGTVCLKKRGTAQA